MRFPTRRIGDHAEGDLTPMIDMTFQLIAFFMVLVNFSEAEQNERIKLPSSLLAKPPDTAAENPLTLQLTADEQVIFGGQQLPYQELPPLLKRERNYMVALGQDPQITTVIIRADGDAKAGVVQELIQMCQEEEFEKFALRAKQEERI